MADILLVDPLMEEADTLSSGLKDLDHNVYHAADGWDGLECLVYKPNIDIVLTAHDIPVVDGYNLSKHIKTDYVYSEYQKIPILGFRDFPDDKREYLSAYKGSELIPNDIARIIKIFLRQE